MKECNSLDDVRIEIDKLDIQIVELIAQRNDYIHQAAKFKATVDEVKAKDRVKEVISHVRQKAVERGVSANMLTELYTIMIDGMVESEIAEFRNTTTF